MHQRHIFQKIWEEIDSSAIIILNGARQVGKTALLTMIKEKLLSEQNVNPSHIHWFDLEQVDDLSVWSNQTTALGILPLKDQTRRYIFIDEFQKSRAIGSILKVLHDHHKQFKIIATGSASWYLTIDESMAGRKRIFTIWPLSWREYTVWRGLSQLYNVVVENIQNINPQLLFKLNAEFIAFVSYGGYPAVVAAEKTEAKPLILRELVNSYILRDVQLAHYSANSLQIEKILTLLASNVSSLLDVQSLSANSGLGRTALLNRLDLLKNTFILHLNKPYFTNKIKELVKNPKVYLVDTGLRHSIMKNFSTLPQTTDFGYAVENTLVTELYKTGGALDEIYYWRTKTGQEVDIVLKNENSITPIEIKSGSVASIPSNLKAFIRIYKPLRAYVLNWSEIKEMPYENCMVYFRPLWFPVY